MALSSFGQEAYNSAMDALKFTAGDSESGDVDKNSSGPDNRSEQTDAVSDEPEQAATEELAEGEQSEDGTPGEQEERSGSVAEEAAQADVSNSELERLREEKRQLQAEFTKSRQELARLRATLDHQRLMQTPQDPDQLATLETEAQQLGFLDVDSYLASERLLQIRMADQNHQLACETVSLWEQSQPNFDQLLPRVQELAAGKDLFSGIPRTLPASQQVALMRDALEPLYRLAKAEHELKQVKSNAESVAARKVKAEADRKKAAAKAASSEMAGKAGVRSPQGTPPAEDPGDAIVRQAGGWYSQMLRS